MVFIFYRAVCHPCCGNPPLQILSAATESIGSAVIRVLLPHFISGFTLFHREDASVGPICAVSEQSMSGAPCSFSWRVLQSHIGGSS